MAVQLVAPRNSLSWLLPPETPPEGLYRAVGWERLSAGGWRLTPLGQEYGPIAQRLLLSYALRISTRQELSRQYAISERSAQAILSGETYREMTAPLRRRLLRLGIGNLRMCKGSQGSRPREIRAATERVMRRASMALTSGAVSESDREQIATDLWLLSGAWLEDGR